MITLKCREKIIEIDKNILKYLPYIENILKYQDKFATNMNDNMLKIYMDPIILTELINFYTMPKYIIPQKYLENTKRLADYMGHEILQTTNFMYMDGYNQKIDESKEYICEINNIYYVNMINILVFPKVNDNNKINYNLIGDASWIFSIDDKNIFDNVFPHIFDANELPNKFFASKNVSIYKTEKIEDHDYNQTFQYNVNKNSLNIINKQLYNSKIRIGRQFVSKHSPDTIIIINYEKKI